MMLDELRHKKILIVGYGIEGKSVEHFLKTYDDTTNITVVDKKDGEGYLDNQKDYDIAIKSPGVRKELVRIPYLTPTNIFFSLVKGKVIGVTGTKGKSTTSSLIYQILQQSGLPVDLVGNIGNPMLTGLEKGNVSDHWYVCELSSYQLDDIEYSPHISVIINFFPDHMNYHGSVEEYWISKKRMIAKATAEDFFVYNPQFDQLRQLAKETKAKAVPYIDHIPFPDSDIPLLGLHNRDNIRAAITVASLFTVSPEIVHQAVRSFTPLPHRLEKVGTFHEITFYDDAISTTPESTICAIQALPGTATIFLGGLDRGYDFRTLVETIEKSAIRTIVLFPESGTKILAEIQKLNIDRYSILQTTDMKEAVRYAYDHTPKHSVCLLSTASPSYSLWKNFEEKGFLFSQYVKEFGK